MDETKMMYNPITMLKNQCSPCAVVIIIMYTELIFHYLGTSTSKQAPYLLVGISKTSMKMK